MILPLVKLGTLALKTACKPIANRLKKEAGLHPKFRQLIVNIAQEDFVIIKEDVATIKSDVHAIKTTLNELKASMEGLLVAVLQKANIQAQKVDSVEDFEETMKEQDEHAANIENIEERKAKINLLTKESMKDHHDQWSEAKEAKEKYENATELSALHKKIEVHIEFIIPYKFDVFNGVMTTLNFLIFSSFIQNGCKCKIP